MNTLKRAVRSNSGFTLVSAMISGAIAVGIGMFVVSMMSNMGNQGRGLSEKLASLDFVRYVTQNLSSAACSLIFTKPGNTSDSLTFDQNSVTYPFSLTFSSIPESMTSDLVNITTDRRISALAPHVLVKAIDGIQVQVEDATHATLRIKLDPSNLTLPLKDLEFPITLATNVVGSVATIIGCSGASSGSGTATGTSCGGRSAMCVYATVTYDMYGATNTQCDGNDLTMTCTNTANPSATGVNGCPAGYTGQATYTGTYWVSPYYNQYFYLTCIKD